MNTLNRHIIIKLIPVTIFFVTIYSVISFSNYIPFDSAFNNTTIWWAISGLILLLLLVSIFYFYDSTNNKHMNFVLLYLIWSIISSIRGIYVAEIYWDWKLLVNNFMIFMLALISYSSTNKIVVQSVFSFYIKYVLPLFVLFAFIIRTDAYGFYLMTISTLLLFYPAFTQKQKIILLSCVLIIIISDLSARSNVIKFLVPLLLLSFYYFRNIVSTRIMETFRIVLFITPIVLLLLGASGTFNVFKIKDYLGKDVNVMGTDEGGNRAEESLVADTRTFLYEEVINSAIYNDYWLFGRTPARGNDSSTFGLLQFEWTGRYERDTNEIGLANVFTWTGLIGVILYSIIFFQASFLAVNRSNNIFIRLIGLYLAFRWFYSWIEDYQTFSLNYFLLMIMWGMCLSGSFRSMSDIEFKIWARGIFDKRYIMYQNLSIKKTYYEKTKDSCIADML